MAIKQIKSDKVQVYPSAYRHLGYNPESRLNTEFNIRTSVASLIDVEGFVIDFNSGVSRIKFNLGGYYFDLDASDFISDFTSTGKIMWAGIKLVNLNTNPTAKEYPGQTLSNNGSISPLDVTTDEVDEFKGLIITDTESDLAECTYKLKLLKGNGTSCEEITESKFKIKGDSITTDNINPITKKVVSDAGEFESISTTGASINTAVIDEHLYVPFISDSSSSSNHITFSSEEGDIIEIKTGTLELDASEIALDAGDIIIGNGSQYINLIGNGSSELKMATGEFDRINIGVPTTFTSIQASDIDSNGGNIQALTSNSINTSTLNVTNEIKSGDISVKNNKIKLDDGSYLQPNYWSADEIDANAITSTNINSTNIVAEKISPNEIVSLELKLDDILVTTNPVSSFPDNDQWFSTSGYNAVIPIDRFSTSVSYSDKCYWVWNIKKIKDSTISVINPLIEYDSSFTFSNGGSKRLLPGTAASYSFLEKLYTLYSAGRIKEIVYLENITTRNTLSINTYKARWNINIERAYHYSSLPTTINGQVTHTGVHSDEYQFLFSMTKTNPLYIFNMADEDFDLYSTPRYGGSLIIHYN